MEADKNFEADYFSDTGYTNIGLHKHDFCELIFVLEGKLGFLVNDKLYKANGKCLIFFRENRLHTSEVEPNCVYTRYNLNFRRSFLSSVADFEKFKACFDSDCTVIPLDDTDFIRINKLFEEFYQNSLTVEKDRYSEEICRHILCAILMYISRISEIKPHAVKDYIDNSYISDAVKYINENLDKKLIIEDIASVLFVSRAKLIYDFKTTTGITVGEYISLCRIKRAKKLLSSGYTVSAAALSSGFPNTCHFIRTFKKHTGVTPLKYAHSHN